MSLQHFSVDKIASVRGKNAFLGHPIAQALVAGHSLIMRFSWHCKLMRFTVAAFHCEGSTHRK